MAAPVALVDDDRPISGVSSSVSGRTAPPPPPPQKGRAAAAATEAAPRLLSGDGDGIELPDSGFSSWESRAFRSSVDRGKDFEEKLTVCFPSVTADTESLARGGAMSADSLPEEDELRKVLTSSYGHVMPVDWKLTSSLHVPTFHLEENPTDVAAELSDEEELREQLDTHSIIVSSLSEEPFFTVEQVIEEIEEMMEDSPDTDAGPDLSQSDRSTLLLDVQRSTGSPGYESRVRTLSVAELSERLEDSETNIRMFSEELVQQLALRDELGFEKEVKNSFISALIDVQNRRKEQRELLKKKKKLKVGAGTSQSLAEKTPGSYLTTVIPYEKKGHPPSLEDLQTLTTILQAMRDDSDKVPSLLTDYILKVLCPT